MLPSFFRQTVTRIRPSTTVSRGSTIFDWSAASTASIPGCSMQPGSTVRDMDGRVLNFSDGYTAYIPPDADVQPGDRIAYDGHTYEIKGDIRKWISPTGAISHIQLNLERWSG